MLLHLAVRRVSFYSKCLFWYGLFCHVALKLDLSTLFATYFFEHLSKLYFNIG